MPLKYNRPANKFYFSEKSLISMKNINKTEINGHCDKKIFAFMNMPYHLIKGKELTLVLNPHSLLHTVKSFPFKSMPCEDQLIIMHLAYPRAYKSIIRKD